MPFHIHDPEQKSGHSSQKTNTINFFENNKPQNYTDDEHSKIENRTENNISDNLTNSNKLYDFERDALH